MIPNIDFFATRAAQQHDVPKQSATIGTSACLAYCIILCEIPIGDPLVQGMQPPSAIAEYERVPQAYKKAASLRNFYAVYLQEFLFSVGRVAACYGSQPAKNFGMTSNSACSATTCPADGWIRCFDTERAATAGSTIMLLGAGQSHTLSGHQGLSRFSGIYNVVPLPELGNGFNIGPHSRLIGKMRASGMTGTT